jgi:hypothetical protein
MLQALDMAIHVDRALEWVFEIALDCRGSSLSEIETAGNDGILNDLVGLAGELHILYIVREQRGSDGAVKLLASESGEVILIPYVFSMIFLPRALSACGQNARPRRRKARHVQVNCADVIIRAHKEFLEGQSCVQKLARKDLSGTMGVHGIAMMVVVVAIVIPVKPDMRP